MAANGKNRTVLWLVGALGVMCVLTALSVPLYRAFCQATGFNGTSQRATVAPSEVTNKLIRVHFDANAHGIPWTFKPDRPYQDIRVGKTAMMYFTVKNIGDHAITGRAIHNILPDTMGAYFMKMQCFCFTNQTLQAGESKQFPVVYFLDPKLMKDADTKDVPDITLSYTFFEVRDDDSNVKN